MVEHGLNYITRQAYATMQYDQQTTLYDISMKDHYDGLKVSCGQYEGGFVALR